MILLLVSCAWEAILPAPKRMDRIDHALTWLIKLCLVVLFVTLPLAVEGEDVKVDPQFFFSCSSGKLEEIKEAIEANPSLVNARTDNGEACLHLTGIYGHTGVTEYLLVHGADPNIRSSFEQGLRMHPLSWNIYGGHVANAAVLLRHGADVNLDFDGMGAEVTPVTALDVVMQLKINEEGDDRFIKMEELLREHGGKTMAELKGTQGEAEL